MEDNSYNSLVGEYLYYVNYIYGKETKQWSSQFYRKNVLDDSEPIQLLQDKASNYVLETFVVDRKQNYYCLGSEKKEGVKYYCLEKWNSEDQLIYSRTFTGDSIPVWKGSDLYGGIADAGAEGIYLVAVREKDILLCPVDMEKGIMDMQNPISVEVTGYSIPEVFSEYEHGIYLSMDSHLWT